jgi:hypothetical protein
MLERAGQLVATVTPLALGAALVTVNTGKPGAGAAAEVLAVLGRSPHPG